MASSDSANYANLAGIWLLDPSRDLLAAARPSSTEGTQECVYEPDRRSVVDVNDCKDGGRYRSIVKLQMRYEGQSPDDIRSFMGTGWLIRPDVLVTAGHVVYNHKNDGGKPLGRAVEVKCCIGYCGRDSIDDPSVQCRRAKHIVTPAEWLLRSSRSRDVAFIKVDDCFVGNLHLFSYLPTQNTGTEELGVVGYPADKYTTGKNGIPEYGSMMYEQFGDIDYNLDSTSSSPPMLRYRISTFGGQSGAPVIRKSAGQVVIATHVYGGGDSNQASLIGPLGNDYDSYLSAFTKEYPAVDEFDGITLIDLQPTVMHGSSPFGYSQPTMSSSDLNTESFFGILKIIERNVSTAGKFIDPFVSPLFKRVGAHMSDVAGVAWSAMRNPCTECVMKGECVDVPPADARSALQDCAERETLADPMIQVGLGIHNEQFAIMADIQQINATKDANFEHTAPKLTPELPNTAYEKYINYLEHETLLTKSSIATSASESATDSDNLVYPKFPESNDDIYEESSIYFSKDPAQTTDSVAKMAVLDVVCSGLPIDIDAMVKMPVAPKISLAPVAAV